MKTCPRRSRKKVPQHWIEPLEARIAPADVDLVLNNGTLTALESAAGAGLANEITVKAGIGNTLVISDPNHDFDIANVPGASISADLRTVTVPNSLFTSLTITTGGGDDTLTVDYTAGNLPVSPSFFGGANNDTLFLKGGTTFSGAFDFGLTGLGGDGNVSYTSLQRVDWFAVEAIDSAQNLEVAGLQYRLAGTATVTDAGGGATRTIVDSNVDSSLTISAPTTTLSVLGNQGTDLINVQSLPANLPCTFIVDGNGGFSDVVTLAAGLPTLPGLNVRAAGIAPVPALTIGAGGLSLVTTPSVQGNIDITGVLDVSGLADLHSFGSLTTSGAGVVKAQTVNATGGTSLSLTLDGGIVSASGGTNGTTLNAVNNAPALTSLVSGSGASTLASGPFKLGKDGVFAADQLLTVDSSLDLNGFAGRVGLIGGVGTITNTVAALSTLTVGTDAIGDFMGTLQGHFTLVKVATGTQALSGTSSAVDGMIVSQGTLRLPAAIGTMVNGPITLDGGTLSYGFSGVFTPQMKVAKNSGIDVDAGQSVTVNSLISGDGGLIKTGDGTLILGNELNSFGPAPVQILGGILQVATDGALGDVDNDVEISEATLAATAGFGSARNFTKTGVTATIDAQAPFLTLINKAFVPGDFIVPIPANLKTAFVYGDTTPVPEKTITVGNTTVSLGGKGTLTIHKLDPNTIDTIELIGSDSTTKLSIKAVDDQTPTKVLRIVVDDPGPNANQIASLGSIVLGTNVQLGDETRDSVPDLYIEGKVGKVQLYDVNKYAVVKLGDGLLYNVAANKTTPDTYNQHPDVKIHEVLGTGVLIDLTPSDLKDVSNVPIGGGGLGKVEVGKWNGEGFVRTTQSMSSFKLLQGDCFVVFQIDKFHVGSGTTANVGSMTVQNGGWGGSGNEIEGGVGSFNANEFLLGATLTCARMGKFNLDAGAFAGLLRVTDPDAPSIPTFTVFGDFSGDVESTGAVTKVRVIGDFTGTLEATFVGSITAYSFEGNGDGNSIATTDGSLGLLTATNGTVKDFNISTSGVFKGFNIKQSKLANSTVGIENVSITAAAIGNITVSLTAAANAAGINLTGIKDSEFISASNIGNVSVTLLGALGGGAATGIKNSDFDAGNTLGKIAVKLTGQDGASLGLNDVSFAGNVIGATTVSVSKGKGMSATARAIEGVDYFADRTIGALTVDGDATATQVHDLQMSAGENIGAVTVKAKTVQFGTLDASAILAGEDLNMLGPVDAAALKRAALGAVNVTGSILNTKLVAGGSIGAITAGKDVTGSHILAGAYLGGDIAIDGDEVYQRTASIAAITVKGALVGTTIAAGVKANDNIFGNANDTAATNLPGTSSIGPIVIGTGTGTASGGVISHQFAIEAGTIKGLKIGGVTKSLASPVFLDSAAPTGESAGDILVRLI